MWFFKQVTEELPAFGSTTKCRACGGVYFKRTYVVGCWEIEYPEHIVATCSDCGCPHNEKLKSEV